jgi:sugar lactone lactonase YvrE
MSVAELGEDGSLTPYPNEAMNGWEPGEDPATRFVCVQSVHVDGRNRLWVLDPANPMFMGTLDGGPKLIQIDLDTDGVVRTFHFDPLIAPQRSYLNDVRINVSTETAFITDSGLGGIVVLELDSGRARRVLDDHPSTKAESTQVVIDGQPFPAIVHSDGIALDEDGGWLYYQALTGRTLYRVSTAALIDSKLEVDSLESRVERFAESGVSDGLLFAPEGVYVSALETGSIKRVGPDGSVEEIVRDPRILWPDSFARDSNGSIWFTTSQIHLGPEPSTPYRIFKMAP